MKKRLIATLLVGAIAVSGTIGLTACEDNSVSLPIGKQVTETAWSSAFDNTSVLNNYTLKQSAKANVTLSGTATMGTSKTHDVCGSAKINVNSTALYDNDGKTSYLGSTSDMSTDSVTDGEKAILSMKSSSGEYYCPGEKDGDNDVYWKADYSKSETLAESEEVKGKETTEQYWRAEKSYNFSNNYAVDLFEDYFYESNDETAQSYKIADLYDKFTYSDGLYTATLYYMQDLEIFNLKDLVECTVTVSIKDGVAAGYRVEVDVKDATLYRKGYFDFTYSCKAVSVISITGLNTTDASKKLTANITKAINKAKADDKDN